MESFKDWCLNNERNDLLEEWDTAKNSNISIDKISAGSAKSVWWIKHYDDPRTGKHFVFEWKTPINVRTYGNSKCPYLINYKIYTGFNDLATIYPELVAEWHPTKNGQMTPYNTGAGSSKQIWWVKHYDDPKTGKHFDFEWHSSIIDKLKYGCPYLSKPAKRVMPGFNDIFTDFPDLKTEWDYEKNTENPLELTSGSAKKVFWKCSNNHSYEMKIYHRTTGHSCPYCAGQKVIPGVDDLVTLNPDFLKEWDYEKNVGINPKDYKLHSNKSVWWKCEMGHEWKTTISHRAGGNRCPHCYKEYGTSFAEQAILFFLRKYFECENRAKVYDKEIDIFIPKMNIGFEYDGIAFHSGEKNVKKEAEKNYVLEKNGIQLFRIKESDKNFYDEDKRTIFCIPDRKYEYLNFVFEILSKLLNVSFVEKFDFETHSSLIYNEYLTEIKENNIVKLYPEILMEWDYEKNGNLKPDYFLPHSNKKVWWKCPVCGSSYFLDINHKTQGNSCPYCSGKKVNSTNSLASKFPELLNFWDYTKNTINPNEVYYSSRRNVWWICEKCGKSYQTAICQRIKLKTNFCSNCFHDLIGLKNREISIKKSGSVFDNKDLIVDWDYNKNNISPTDVPQTSGEYAFWKCSKCGFEWKAKIINRKLGTGCPRCRNEESHKKHRKAVEQCNLEGVVIQTFCSIRDAISITKDQNVPKCLNGKIASSKGFIYRYKI